MGQTKNPSQPGNAGSTAVRSLPGDFGSLCSWSCKICEFRLFWEQCHGQRFSGTAKHSMPQWPRHRTMSGKKDSNVDSRAWELDSYRSYFTSEPEARMSPSKQSVWYPALLRKPRICFQHADTAFQIPRDSRISSMQQFQCTKCLNTCKHNSTASSKKRKSLLESSVPVHAQTEQESNAKRRRPKPPRKRANFSPQRNPRLPEKNTMFRANPNIKIASMIHENEAFVRGLLQIPRVEALKTRLSCKASFKFDSTQLQSTLLNST